MLPHAEVFHFLQAVVQAVHVALLNPDAGGQVAGDALHPFFGDYFVPADETLRGNLRHAVVSGQDEVEFFAGGKGLQAKVQAVHEAVHVLGHLFAFGREGAVYMPLVVRLVKIAHHQLRAFGLREAHQAHNLVAALFKGPVRIRIPMAVVGGKGVTLRPNGNVGAHPVNHAAFHTLLLGGNPDGLSAVITGVVTGFLVVDGIAVLRVRIPETVVHQPVVVRYQARCHGVVVGEGGGGEGRLHAGLHAHCCQRVEEGHVVVIGIIPTASVQGNDNCIMVVFTLARGPQKAGQKDEAENFAHTGFFNPTNFVNFRLFSKSLHAVFFGDS